jgi:hypothetical protein
MLITDRGVACLRRGVCSDPIETHRSLKPTMKAAMNENLFVDDDATAPHNCGVRDDRAYRTRRPQRGEYSALGIARGVTIIAIVAVILAGLSVVIFQTSCVIKWRAAQCNVSNWAPSVWKT